MCDQYCMYLEMDSSCELFDESNIDARAGGCDEEGDCMFTEECNLREILIVTED